MSALRLMVVLALLAAAAVAMLLLSEPTQAAIPESTAPAVAVEHDAARGGPHSPASSGQGGTETAELEATPLAAHAVAGRFGPAVPSEGRTARLTGRITVEGNAGSATLTFTAGPNLGATHVTEPDGSYDWPDLYPGYALLQVDAGALCTREITLRHRRTDTRDLDFGAHGVLLGKLLDPDGAPVAGAEVELDGNRAYSGGNGWFELPRVAAGDSLLIVRASGFVAYLETVRASVGRSQDSPLEVELQRGSMLALSVGALPEGAASDQDALVWLLPSAGERLTGIPPRSAYPWHELNPLRMRPGGSITLHDMPHCRIDAVALHPLARGREFAWLTANPALAEIAVPLHVDFEATELVTVHVQLGGEPVPGVRVELTHANRMAASLQALSATDGKLLNTQALQIVPGAKQVTQASAEGVALLGLDENVKGAPFLSVITADGALQITRQLAPGERALLIDLGQPGVQ